MVYVITIEPHGHVVERESAIACIFASHSFSRRMSFAIGFLFAISAVACASPTATLSTTPASTGTPTVAPTATPVTVADTIELQVIEADIFAALEEILRELGPRESATIQEWAAAAYLKSNFEELGYDVQIQSFPVENLALGGLGLTLDGPQSGEFVALPMQESGLGNVSGVRYSQRRS